MTELSRTARAVFEAYNSKFEWIDDGVPAPQFKALAAALRAVANQIKMEKAFSETDADAGVFAAHHAIYAYLLVIAAELEAFPPYLGKAPMRFRPLAARQLSNNRPSAPGAYDDV